MNTPKKIAILIDGDNANPKSLPMIFEELRKYGDIHIKRVYGDFSKQNLASWKSFAIKYGIRTIHGFSYTKGKNSTDFNLIIDAMDLLYKNEIDIFCIVSSDCDFTGIINRIKENRILTIGVGRKDSCAPYKDACDIFIEVENLKLKKEAENKSESNHIDPPKPYLFIIPAPKLPGPKVVGKMDLNKL